ncbi:hypothetical protein EYZ11_009736 [Aspergillus tanneri]|uniref:Hpc2-related domain-containing protein n=1 Tax=Aspergillus tanneri TaxID=1220188 RepID=A0A4S3J7B6_9EURO|nr:hypothetical protein EYZ11_009736 [Aspergillus tanneri]
MSPGPSVWPAQDELQSRSPVDSQPRESRPRRSRRKKDEEADPDRKDSKSSKSSKTKEKDREKSKDKDSNIKEIDKEKDVDQKEAKRGNRRPRDKSVSTPNHSASNSSSAPSRKKPKLEETPPEPPSIAASTTAAAATPAPSTPAASPPAPAAPAASSSIHPHPTQSHLQQPPRPPLHSSSSLSPSSHPAPPPPAPVQSYPTMAPVGPPPRPQSQPPPPPPARTSGQNFDPIRSAFDTASPAPALVSTPVPGASSTFSPPAHPPSPRPPFRASASPAIASIIDPPTNSSPPVYAPRRYVSPSHGASAYSLSPGTTPAIAPTPPPPPQQQQQVPQPRPVSPYAHRSPYAPPPQPQPLSHESPSAGPSPKIQPGPPLPPPMSEPVVPIASNANKRALSPEPTPMDVDAEPSAPATAPAKAPKKDPKAPPSAPPSNATSPKPPRAAKEAPPPLPQGSGLISNALFGVGDGSSTGESASRRTPNIILHIPLQGNGDRIVNFARLAEEQYGFAALHPRLAAHKERLARVAAAGAALERNDKSGRGLSAGESADEDLSLEMDRDSDLDGEGTMAASAARTNGPEATEGKKKRRKKKMEEYDRDDPFVDDSELAWQEQAAASKDGFFVYTPTVPSNAAVVADAVVGVEARHPLSIKCHWRPQFQYPRKQASRFEVLGREEAIRVVRGQRRPVSKRTMTSRVEHRRQRKDGVVVSLVAEGRRAAEEERHRRLCSSWLRDPILPLPRRGQLPN